MRETLNLCFGLRDNMLMGAFRSCVVTYIIDLLTRAYWRLALDLHVYVPPLKRRLLLWLSLFLTVLFICMCRNWSFNPMCRTTGVEDTNWSLTAIPFKVGVNNSWKNLCYYIIRKKGLPSFRSCKVYKSLILSNL